MSFVTVNLERAFSTNVLLDSQSGK